MKNMKTAMFSIIFLIALVLFLVTGCGSNETISETTQSSVTTAATAVTSTSTSSAESTSVSASSNQEKLQQILADSLLAFKDVTSYKFEANMHTAMKITGGSNSADMNMDMTMAGISDVTRKEMQMNMDMSMSSDAPDFPEELKNVKADMYMVSGSIYMKMNIPGMGDQWIKMPVSEEMMAQYDLNLVDQQLQFLESPAEISLLKEETFDGSECYVMKVVPDMQKLMQWMSEQQFSGDLDLNAVEKISDAFQELSLVSWIDKNNKQIRKMDLNMVMEIVPGQLDTEEVDFDKMNMDIDMQMNISGYNQPYSIVLPEEAQNAMEISPEMMAQ